MNFTASSFERMMKQKAPAPGSRPGQTAQRLRLLRLSLLAGPALCLLLSETFSQAGRREVTLWPAN